MFRTNKANVFLWVVQCLLAALYLFSGGMKLVMSAEALTAGSSLPAWFLRFIGAAEITGAFGLILPGLFHIRTVLTPVAAACLVVIMIGATVTTLPMGMVAAIPATVGVLAALVAYGRWRIAPLRDKPL